MRRSTRESPIWRASGEGSPNGQGHHYRKPLYRSSSTPTTQPKPNLPSIVELAPPDAPLRGRVLCDNIIELGDDEVLADHGVLTPAGPFLYRRSGGWSGAQERLDACRACR